MMGEDWDHSQAPPGGSSSVTVVHFANKKIKKILCDVPPVHHHVWQGQNSVMGGVGGGGVVSPSPLPQTHPFTAQRTRLAGATQVQHRADPEQVGAELQDREGGGDRQLQDREGGDRQLQRRGDSGSNRESYNCSEVEDSFN